MKICPGPLCSKLHYYPLTLYSSYYYYHTFAHISHASKVMLKIFQARLQRYVKGKIPVFKLDLEKAEEPEIKLPTSTGSWEKEENSRKAPISALLIIPKPLTVWITINCGKF